MSPSLTRKNEHPQARKTRSRIPHCSTTCLRRKTKLPPVPADQTIRCATPARCRRTKRPLSAAAQKTQPLINCRKQPHRHSLKYPLQPPPLPPSSPPSETTPYSRLSNPQMSRSCSANILKKHTRHTTSRLKSHAGMRCSRATRPANALTTRKSPGSSAIGTRFQKIRSAPWNPASRSLTR